MPTHRKFTISFDVSKFSAAEQKQLFIARLDEDMKPNYVATYKRENTFSTKTRKLGIYTLVKDSIAPEVSTKNFKPKKWLNNYKYLSLKISDDLSGINTYSATLNGKWILMEYEPKTKTLTYNFDDVILKEKQYNLKVVVTDNVGNRKIFNTIFYRN